MSNKQNIIDKIKHLTVKITLNICDSVEVGTGVILNIKGDFYILTVHHVIYGKEANYDTKSENLIIESFDGKKLKVNEIEDLKSLVLLAIDCIDFEPPNLFILDKAYYEHAYYLRGFPEAINGGDTSHPFNDVSCDEKTTEFITLNIKNMNDDSSGVDTIQNINGMSGSGVFFEQFGKLFLVGSVNKLLNSSGVFNGAIANTLLDLIFSKNVNIEFDTYRTIEDITEDIKSNNIKITKDEMEYFKEKKNDHFDNLNRKNETIFPVVDVFKKNKIRIEQFLKGEMVVDELTVIHSTFKDKWLNLLTTMLEYIESNYSDIIDTKYAGQARIIGLVSYIKESINTEFPFINNTLLEKLSGYVISKWLLDCNINFIIEEI